MTACFIAYRNRFFYIFATFSGLELTIRQRKQNVLMRAVSIVLATLTLTLTHNAGAQSPSVQLKVRESGLFGLKGERSATVQLTGRDRTLPLTDENVNGGQYFFFLFYPNEDWILDTDFFQEELPKLTIVQDSLPMQIAWTSDLPIDSVQTSITLGFPKHLKLHLPFTFQFFLNGDTSRGELKIPPEYWPGFSPFTRALNEAENAVT